jgi:hypothetical protein
MSHYQVIVTTECNKVVVTDNRPVVKVGSTGLPGPPGVEGPPGPQGPNGDKSYTVSFTNQTTVVVQHNLEKYPAVTFKDSAGTEYEVDVHHDSINQCTVTWNTPLTGSITCN